MSLFGSLMGDFDEDAIFGQHMRQMRQMNNMNNFMGMGSLMPDPFNMLTPFDSGFGGQRNNLFGFPGMPNLNRLLTAPDIGSNCASFSSSSVISMSSGPDGRPQVYQATSSTKTGPGGVRETRKTVQDSRSGLKKMAIGHHIGERAHIIEREQNTRSGQHEEHQEYINLDEEEADEFNREFTHKVRGSGHQIEMIGSGQYSAPTGSHQTRNLPAIAAPPSSADKNTSTNSSTTSATTTYPSITSSRRARNIKKVTTRRPLRTPTSSPLALTTPSTSMHSHPYNASAARRNFRAKHSKQHSVNTETIEKK